MCTGQIPLFMPGRNKSIPVPVTPLQGKKARGGVDAGRGAQHLRPTCDAQRHHLPFYRTLWDTPGTASQQLR